MGISQRRVHGAKRLGDVRLDRVQLYDCRTSWSPTYTNTNSKAHIESLRVSPLFSVLQPWYVVILSRDNNLPRKLLSILSSRRREQEVIDKD